MQHAESQFRGKKGGGVREGGQGEGKELTTPAGQTRTRCCTRSGCCMAYTADRYPPMLCPSSTCGGGMHRALLGRCISGARRGPGACFQEVNRQAASQAPGACAATKLAHPPPPTKHTTAERQKCAPSGPCRACFPLPAEGSALHLVQPCSWRQEPARLDASWTLIYARLPRTHHPIDALLLPPLLQGAHKELLCLPRAARPEGRPPCVRAWASGQGGLGQGRGWRGREGWNRWAGTRAVWRADGCPVGGTQKGVAPAVF